MAIGIRAAQEAFKHNFWVAFQFDGQGANLLGGVSGGVSSNQRVVSWAQDPSFTWFKFVNGDANVTTNPDWSLKRWYQWGARNFHIHMPFGKPNLQVAVGGQSVVLSHPEHLAYQPDAFICARDGFVDEFQDTNFLNTAMPWLTNDFEKVWSALCKGVQGNLTDAQWYSLTTWFNPADPIKVIAYNGTISESGYYRWSLLFNENYSTALQRLKNSVQPFINCGMRVGLDALVEAPGSTPGQLIPKNKLSHAAQQGWWEFYTWLETQVGAANIYMEAHPFKRQTYDLSSGVATGQKVNNPYVGRGIGVLCEDESSYFNSQMSPDYHLNSELGRIHYLRAIGWMNLHGDSAPKTGRFKSQLAFPRYSMFDSVATTMAAPARTTNLPNDLGERRVIFRSQNAYGQGIIHEIAAIGLTQRFHQEQDTNSANDKTRFGFVIENQRLQRFASSQIPAGQTQFVDRFSDSGKFIQYLANYTPPTLSTGDTMVSPPPQGGA